MGLSKWLDADKKKQWSGHTHLFSSSLSWGEDMDLCFHVACQCIFEQPHLLVRHLLGGSKPLKNCIAYWKAKLFVKISWLFLQVRNLKNYMTEFCEWETQSHLWVASSPGQFWSLPQRVLFFVLPAYTQVWLLLCIIALFPGLHCRTRWKDL